MILHAWRLNRCTSSILAPAKIVKCKQIVSNLFILSLLAEAHNLKAVGSIPAPATNDTQELTIRKFLFYAQISRFTAETARFSTLPLLFWMILC